MRNIQDKYNYVSHPEHLPLQLKGNSKKKIEPLRKENFNQTKCTLNQQSKSLLMKKLSNNVHNFNQNKSIVPQPEQRHRTRPSSIKTFKENKENVVGSGVEYLLQKTENTRPTNHKEKAHIQSTVKVNSKVSEKKHFMSNNYVQQTNYDMKAQIRHRQTANIKLSQDIYANVYRKQREALAAKKIESNNYFKTGVELGLEEMKKRHVSDNKMIEIMGSQHSIPNKKQSQATKRQDWRISNIF